MPLDFTEDQKTKFEAELTKLLTHFPNKQAALLPTLRLAERYFRYNDDDTCDYISQLLELPAAKVAGVLSFYTHYNREHHGKYRIMTCMTLPCALRKSQEIVDHIKDKLKIDVGECTEDGKFSLEHVECLAVCHRAPAIQINEDYYYELTPEKVDEILDNLE